MTRRRAIGRRRCSYGALNTRAGCRCSRLAKNGCSRTSGRTFPVWDFNDIDVSAARDPANKLSFFVTVDGVEALPNIWTARHRSTHAIPAAGFALQV